MTIGLKHPRLIPQSERTTEYRDTWLRNIWPTVGEISLHSKQETPLSIHNHAVIDADPDEIYDLEQIFKVSGVTVAKLSNILVFTRAMHSSVWKKIPLNDIKEYRDLGYFFLENEAIMLHLARLLGRTIVATQYADEKGTSCPYRTYMPDGTFTEDAPKQ